jgi:DNA-binding NarL/FixJ family response regulator
MGTCVPLTVLYAGNDSVFEERLRDALAHWPRALTLVHLRSFEDVIATLERRQRAALVLDPYLSGCDGFFGVLTVHHRFSRVPILLPLQSAEPSIIARARAFGAHGVIERTAPLDLLARAVDRLLHGQLNYPDPYVDLADDIVLLNGHGPSVERLATLTASQVRVLHGLADGLLNKQIAFDMGISEATVKAHLTALFRKLAVNNRTQAVIAARALDIGPPSL